MRQLIFLPPPTQSKTSPKPSETVFKQNRTPYLTDEEIQKVNIADWKRENTADTNVVHFANEGDKLTIDRGKNEVAIKGTSVKEFKAMFTVFQQIYGKDAMPSLSLLGAANNAENRLNCKVALNECGYNPETIEEIFKAVPEQKLASNNVVADEPEPEGPSPSHH